MIDYLWLALVIVLALNLPLAAYIGYRRGYSQGTWAEHAAISEALRHNVTPYHAWAYSDASEGVTYDD